MMQSYGNEPLRDYPVASDVMAEAKARAGMLQRRIGEAPRETAVEGVANRLRSAIGRLVEANAIVGAMQERLLGPVPSTANPVADPDVPAMGFAAINRLLSALESEVSRTYSLAQRGNEIA